MQALLPYLFIAVGLFAILVAIFIESEKIKLKKTGIQTEGIVFDQEYSSSSGIPLFDRDHHHIMPKNQIWIRFVTKQEEWITDRINQEYQIFFRQQYRTGEKVTVYYEEANPTNFYVDTKQSDTGARIGLAFIGFSFLIGGLYFYFFE